MLPVHEIIRAEKNEGRPVNVMAVLESTSARRYDYLFSRISHGLIHTVIGGVIEVHPKAGIEVFSLL